MPIQIKTTSPEDVLVSSPLPIVENWPYDFQYIERNSDYWDYLAAYASELHRIDILVDELYEERFVETATSEELEKKAVEVGITRRESETDKELRFRAQLRKAVAASDGTPADIEGILTIAFGEETLSEITVTHAVGRPVTQFNIPQDSLNDIPLIREELQSELERAFPAGYGVELTTTDTWTLGESGEQGLGEGGLT